MELLISVSKSLGWQLLILLGPAFLLGYLLNLEKRGLTRVFARLFGPTGFLWTGWIGTPIHETSHALFCILFGHTITDYNLFTYDEKKGQLGFVDHTFNPASRYQVIGNFFIGIAPLLVGAGILWLLTYFMLPHLNIRAAFNQLDINRPDTLLAQGVRIFEIIANALAKPDLWTDWVFWVYLYLVLCVGSHMAPSKTDLKAGGRGFLVLLVLLLLTGSAVFFFDEETRYLNLLGYVLNPVISLLIFAVALNLIILIIVYLFSLLFGRARESAAGSKGSGKSSGKGK